MENKISIKNREILELLDSIEIDKFYVICHFKCHFTHKTVISTVPFEPYDGKIEITLKDILLHPIKSYNRYYHTPITIYNHNCNDTIVLKAFEKVSKYFVWDTHLNKYIYNNS